MIGPNSQQSDINTEKMGKKLWSEAVSVRVCFVLLRSFLLGKARSLFLKRRASTERVKVKEEANFAGWMSR